MILHLGVRRGLAVIPDNTTILRQVALPAKSIGEQFLFYEQFGRDVRSLPNFLESPDLLAQ